MLLFLSHHYKCVFVNSAVSSLLLVVLLGVGVMVNTFTPGAFCKALRFDNLGSPLLIISSAGIVLLP